MHEVVQVRVRLDAETPIPDIEAVPSAGARELDVDSLMEHLAVRRIQRVRQAIDLGHLLEWAQQREADDVEQCDGTARDIGDAVAPDQAIYDLGFIVGQRQWLPQAHVHRLGIQQLGCVGELTGRETPGAGQHAHDERVGVGRRARILRRCAGGRDRVVGDRVVMHDQQRDAVRGRRPAENEILAERPERVQPAVEFDQVAALAQIEPVIEPDERVRRDVLEQAGVEVPLVGSALGHVRRSLVGDSGAMTLRP